MNYLCTSFCDHRGICNIVSQTKLTIICALCKAINQVCGHPIKLHLLICLVSTIVWYNEPNRPKNHTSNPFTICKNGKLHFNPGLSIFWNSIFMNKFRNEFEYYVGIFILAQDVHMYNTHIQHNMHNHTLYSQ